MIIQSFSLLLVKQLLSLMSPAYTVMLATQALLMESF
jgi:hypothetical protein